MKNSKYNDAVYKLYVEANQTLNAQPATSPRQPPDATPPSASYDWKTIEDPIKGQFVDSLLSDMKSFIAFKEHSADDSVWCTYTTPGEVYKDFLEYVGTNTKSEEEEL